MFDFDFFFFIKTTEESVCLTFRYEELLTSEKVLSQEVQQLEMKFENWTKKAKQETYPTRPVSAKPLASARDVTKDLPPEVAAFDVSAV